MARFVYVCFNKSIYRNAFGIAEKAGLPIFTFIYLNFNFCFGFGFSRLHKKVGQMLRMTLSWLWFCANGS